MNHNPEKLARDKTDHALLRSGRIVQSYKQNNIAAGLGVAIREYPTDNGTPDYILLVNRKPVRVYKAMSPIRRINAVIKNLKALYKVDTFFNVSLLIT